jgi:hypothetical protein
MQRLGYDRLIVGLVALAVVIGVSWIVLEYLVPYRQPVSLSRPVRKELRLITLEKDIEHDLPARE